ncbi:hypothetical protein [Chryseobacterium jejuense]|uniref:hypothetical protein n=1 Tax=Chryseobacterium jejuense TaxID=445960 RepID=UPI001AEA3AC6|nr:hypothetical protein [Chryseobacterium jejuense]MBP2616523.1 hypothetical protein [Chryseobacterium jejuense]
MTPVLIECKGISTDIFSIGPFTLRKGETIGIYTGNNDTHSAEQYLTAIFTGKAKHRDTSVYEDFTFVDYLWEPEWRRILWPITVGEYLKKNADLNCPFSQKIYEYEWINKKTKIHTLPGNPRKLLSLYSVLSKNVNIIVDFAGQPIDGILFASKVIQEEINKGRSAILFDAHKNLENRCNHYIEIKWKDNRKYYKPVYHFPED